MATSTKSFRAMTTALWAIMAAISKEDKDTRCRILGVDNCMEAIKLRIKLETETSLTNTVYECRLMYKVVFSCTVSPKYS